MVFYCLSSEFYETRRFFDKHFWVSITIRNTVQSAYKAVQIRGMSAYSVGSPGLDSCECIGICIGESRLHGFSGYKGDKRIALYSLFYTALEIKVRDVVYLLNSNVKSYFSCFVAQNTIIAC